MEENMQVYNKLRTPPKEALKPIEAGRLKGFTDINPMWRIKALTELFGPCGKGWYIGQVRSWIEPGAEEKAAFVELNLYVKTDGEWSSPIYGIGGSRLVAAERNGPRLDDECYKKAYSDAIGVACKALGMAADVYFERDRTKYTREQEEAPPPASQKHERSRAEKIERIRRAYEVDKENCEFAITALKEQGLVANKKVAAMTDSEFSIFMVQLEKRFKAAA